ncbi:hypothetical protein ACTMU2_11955 [Cupriavidus basilensis]
MQQQAHDDEFPAQPMPKEPAVSAYSATGMRPVRGGWEAMVDMWGTLAECGREGWKPGVSVFSSLSETGMINNQFQ